MFLRLLPLLLFALNGTVAAQPLDSLRQLLRENNPELQSLAYEYRANLSVGRQMSQLPDLEIGTMVSVMPVETRLGPQEARFGVTQMLPWPGTLAAMSALADAQAQPVLEEAAAVQLDLLYQLETNYFEVLAAEAKIEVLDTTLQLYGSLRRLALSRVESSRGSSVDVYRAELQLTAAERRIQELRAEQALAWTMIEELVNRELPREPYPVDPPLVRPLPAAAELEGHPLLRIFRLQEEISRRAIELNDLEARPDFSIGMDYVAVGKRMDMRPNGNGRDAIMPRVMVSVPLSGGKYRAKRDEEQFRLQSIASRREAVTRQLTAALERAEIARLDATARLDFLADQIATLGAILQIARSEYANSQRPFDELLEVQDQLIEYRLEAIEAQRTLLIQAATVDRYLPRR
ncbi:TolC family protein [Neolewinella litorea]|nr:TolC family protein [Neolewinella litorea]